MPACLLPRETRRARAGYRLARDGVDAAGIAGLESTRSERRRGAAIDKAKLVSDALGLHGRLAQSVRALL